MILESGVFLAVQVKKSWDRKGSEYRRVGPLCPKDSLPKDWYDVLLVVDADGYYEIPSDAIDSRYITLNDNFKEYKHASES